MRKGVKYTQLRHGTRAGYTYHKCRCFACRAAHSQESREFRERVRIKSKEWQRRIRREAENVLGDKCVQCGFADRRALQIDHILSDGHSEGHRYKLYQRIVKEGAQGRYQLLCANCNAIKRHTHKEFPTGNPGKRRVALIDLWEEERKRAIS